MTHVGLFLQQLEHASVTGTGSYVIDTLSCQQQRKMYDREAVMRRRWVAGVEEKLGGRSFSRIEG